MKNQEQHATARMTQSVCLAIVLLAGFFAARAPAKDQSADVNSATIVDFEATVSGVREIPAGGPMPGIHLVAKVDNRTTDIYLAPTSFLADCGVSFSKGDRVHVVGSISKSGDADLVLAREITSGRITLYLRDKEGEPLWPGASTIDR